MKTVIELRQTVGDVSLASETLRSALGHLTATGKPRFAVSGLILAVCPYLRLKDSRVVAGGCHVSFHSSVDFYFR